MGAADIGAAAMTNEQVSAVGDEFALAYYAALVAGPSTLSGFYGPRSEHLFLLRGSSDVSAHGPNEVQQFAARMGYDRCRVCVESVDTIRVRTNRFVVLVVGKMMCPWGSAPEGRKFVQSTVVRWRAPSKFSVVGTVFMFDDAISGLDSLEENTTCTEDNDDHCKPKSPSLTLPDQKRHTVPPATNNADCVRVARLPKSFCVEDLRTEFSRFGQVIGADIMLGPKRKGKPVKSRHGIVCYDLAVTTNTVIQFGTVTLASGDVVAVERATNVRLLPGATPC